MTTSRTAVTQTAAWRHMASAAFLFIAGIAPLSSAPLSWVSYDYCFTGCNSGHTMSGQLAQSSVQVPLQQETASTPGTFGYATLAKVSGSASLGTLRGMAYSQLVPTGIFPLNAAANSSINLYFGDRLYFDSSSLSSGSGIQYKLTVTLDSNISQTGMDCGFLPAGGGYAQLGSSGALITNTFCDSIPNGTRSASVVLNSTVGGFRDLVVQLTLYSGVESNATPISQRSTTSMLTSLADASSTGHVYIDVVTSGVTLRSDSGVSYSSVPEPSTFGMAGTLLIGIAAWLTSARLRRAK